MISMIWELNVFFYSDTHNPKGREGGGTGRGPACADDPSPEPHAVLGAGGDPADTGRPPTGRGNQVCVFSRPGAGRSAAPPRPVLRSCLQMRLRLFSSLTRVLLSTKQTVDSQG